MGTGRTLGTLALCLVLTASLAAGCAAEDGDGSVATGGEDDGLEVGTEAPPVRLKNQDQETVVISDYEGVHNVILVFFPLAFTPV